MAGLRKSSNGGVGCEDGRMGGLEDSAFRGSDDAAEMGEVFTSFDLRSTQSSGGEPES